jgi:uncharacterized protein (DUF169 family)
MMSVFSTTVGVRVLQSAEGFADVPIYRGVSYCDAVRRAGAGEVLRVLPGSIRTCRWAEVVLGFKKPQGRFEEGLAPRLSFPCAGLLLAPLSRFPGEPEVVVVRTTPEVLREMIEVAGSERLWEEHGGQMDRSALPFLTGRRTVSHHKRRRLIGAVNRVLAALARLAPWQALTRWFFRNSLVTAGFDALISRTLADMSVCRNSTVIPLLTGRANISFFCAGGITWGRNDPHCLTSGWAWDDFERVCKSANVRVHSPEAETQGRTHD